jgi:hypothetical protein
MPFHEYPVLKKNIKSIKIQAAEVNPQEVSIIQNWKPDTWEETNIG